MDYIIFKIPLGNTEFEYSIAFALSLLIGWLTILFYINAKFDQPAYDIDKDDPASVMMPRFFSSQHLYLRGCLIYAIGMTAFFLILSLSGPTILNGILSVYQDPAAASKAMTAAAHASAPGGKLEPFYPMPYNWPLVVALGLVGIAPNIAGLRVPELVLRRFSQRVALIPAYARYLVSQMQNSQFNDESIREFKYPSGIHHRPAAGAKNPTDETWRKTCMIASRLKAMIETGQVPSSGTALREEDKPAISQEIEVLFAALHAFDDKFETAPKSELGSQADRLFARICLLLACSLLAFQVRNISDAMKQFGFVLEGANAPKFGSIIVITITLYVLLLVVNFGLLATLGTTAQIIVQRDVMLNCVSVLFIVIAYGSAIVAAIGTFNKLTARGAWYPATWSGRLIAYLRLSFVAYAAACLALALMLSPFLIQFGIHDGINKLLTTSILRSIPCALSATFAAAWLRRGSGALTAFLGHAAVASISVAAAAGLVSFILCKIDASNFLLMQVTFDTGQGLAAGAAMALVAEVVRLYRASVAFPPPVPPLAVPA